MIINTAKKVYFASDNHLGVDAKYTSQQREKIFVTWLSSIQKDAGVLFLLGDLFDFWVDYKKVVPRGFVRVLGKLAEIAEDGVSVHFFVGNHDLWMTDYFQRELGISVHRKPKDFTINSTTFFIGHGDGLGPGDTSYKRMKRLFTNRFLQFLFRGLHPNFAIRLGQYLSEKKKLTTRKKDDFSRGSEERLAQHAKIKLKSQHRDYFVFGHRHLPMEVDLNGSSKYFNVGDWITHFSYGVFEGRSFKLKTWRGGDRR